MTVTVKLCKNDRFYGFVAGADGTDYFFHTKNCAPGLAGSVQGGDRVEFDPVAMPRGPRADNVRR